MLFTKIENLSKKKSINQKKDNKYLIIILQKSNTQILIALVYNPVFYSKTNYFNI